MYAPGEFRSLCLPLMPQLTYCRDDATNFDEGTVTNYLSILILSCHGSPTQLSEIADTLFLSRVASLVEDSMWSTTIRLNAFLLLSYLPKLDETSFPRLLSTMLKRTSPHDPLHAGKSFCRISLGMPKSLSKKRYFSCMCL